MEIFTTIESLSEFLESERKKNKKIGLVPTMGALHSGHISLISASKQKADCTVCSVYVNPTQFNDPGDHDNYPRTEEQDAHLLEEAGCNVCFIPTAKEMYPNGLGELLKVDLNGIDRAMEGKHRPGHFDGVVTVVNRLFEIVSPNYAFFGEKDFQQLATIRKMVEVLKMAIEVVGCPIIRESDGLAMSSRNQRLTVAQRKSAPLIYQLLTQVKEGNHSMEEMKNRVARKIAQEETMRLDYFEIAQEETLQVVDEKNAANKRAFIAVFVGDVRLIDNIALNR